MSTRHNNMKTLTKRERIERALNFEEVDRIPIVDYISHPGLIHHYAGTKPWNGWTKKELGLCAQNCLDMIQELTPSKKPQTLTLDDGRTMTQELANTWVEQEELTCREYAVRLEKEMERLKKAKGEENRGDYAGFNCQTGKSFAENYKRGFLEDQKCLGDTVLMLPYFSVCPLDYAYHQWENFSLLCQDNPGIFDEIVKERARIWVERIPEVADKSLSPMVLIAGDIAHKAGMLVSPDFLRRAYFPAIKKLTGAWHEHGIKVIYHSEGDIRAVLDDLVEAGIDGINPLEPDSNMGMKEVRGKYPKLVLWGGVDNAWLLTRGTPEQTKEAVIQLIEDVGRGGGIMLGSSGEFHIGCKKENGIAMVETIRNYRLN